MTNEILQGLVWDADGGRLTYNGVRYLLIRPEVMASIQNSIDDALGDRVAAVFYKAGVTGGTLSSRRFKEVFGYSDEEIVTFMCHMGGQIGWGRFELVELDPGAGRLIVQVYGSPYAEAYGAAEHGVCYLIRGVMAGLGAGIFDSAVDAIETDCQAKGDSCCRFVVTRREVAGGE
ncbi:MAG: hypothetical protein M5U01_04955 [Ardenticatenaceae bacterium]|nr:hypothetical protein [Ardenticatenaceae bacterium]HBY97170.1 hypothetical protein [Chloroflexota bacterium]